MTVLLVCKETPKAFPRIFEKNCQFLWLKADTINVVFSERKLLSMMLFFYFVQLDLSPPFEIYILVICLEKSLPGLAHSVLIVVHEL